MFQKLGSARLGDMVRIIWSCVDHLEKSVVKWTKPHEVQLMTRFWSTLPHVFLADTMPKVPCEEHYNTESWNSQLLLTCRDQLSASA